jgi:integrase
MRLAQIKTVEVERWLRSTEVAEGTRAKIKCVMSALFSHAVRWELCDQNPISSGIPVGTGGKRGPSTGVRVSAQCRKTLLKLTAQQVAEALTTLEFRDQLLVFMDAGLDVRRGELGALRWQDCDLSNTCSTFSIPITGVAAVIWSTPNRRPRPSRCRCIRQSKILNSGSKILITAHPKTADPKNR